MLSGNYVMLNINRKRGFKNKGQDSNKIIGIGFVVVIVAVGAFVLWNASSQGDGTSSEVELPDYAYRTASVTQGYVASLEIESLFEQIPCYCGCGGIGHMSLLHCFHNGYGVFSQHAAGCNVCVDEALTLWNMHNDGASILEIRNTIDDYYTSRGYEPTNTPMPRN